MKSRDTQRQIVLERMADHLLAVGLRGASLRPLAAAAGTSDRMLLYYFTDRAHLLDATLALIAGRLRSALENARTGRPMPFQHLLAHLGTMMADPAIRPFMKLWLELAAAASRDEEPFRHIARQICEGFLAFIAQSLRVTREADRAPAAALLLATLEGLLLLDAVGCADKSRLAAEVAYFKAIR